MPDGTQAAASIRERLHVANGDQMAQVFPELERHIVKCLHPSPYPYTAIAEGRQHAAALLTTVAKVSLVMTAEWNIPIRLTSVMC